VKRLICKRCHSKLGVKAYMAGDVVENPTAKQLKIAKINHNQWKIIDVVDNSVKEKPEKEVSNGKSKH